MNEIEMEMETNGNDMDIASVVEASGSEGSLCKVLLVLGGIAVAGIATVFGVKAWKQHKENTKLNQPNEGEVVEPTEDQIMEVAGK